MSKQLSIAATASVLAMALFALSAHLDERPTHLAHKETGATAEATAPAIGQLAPAFLSIR